jgi:ABC-type nitrate/sulfonate/bicarbonate transport system substrate-binding protein
MHITFAHYRNRFCMFRTYYALAAGLVKPEGFTISIIEVPDPPSRAQEEALIRGEVQAANLYLPNFLRCRIDDAPIRGISTEWKSTIKGNGMFVRADGPVKTPQDLAGRLIATHHKTPHVVHRYLLKHRYGVDLSTIRWESHPQEELLDILKSGKADAVVLIDQFFFRGENDPTIVRLYSDGEAWGALTGFPEMIKHMVAVREQLLKEQPDFRHRLLAACKASIAYSEQHLPEIADKFIERYGGEREAVLSSARYPKIEFTFTDTEKKIAEAEMKMLAEMGEIPREIPVAPQFVTD